MGNKQSQTTSHAAAMASPSAAFGRLRINQSPHLQSLAARRARRSAPDSLNSLKESSSWRATTETTRLLQASPLETGPSFDETVMPPMAVWLTPALVCALCYALYNICIKKGSASIHPVLGGLLLQYIAAMLGTCLWIGLWYTSSSESLLFYDKTGIQWSIAAGVAVGLAEMISFGVSGLGVPAMQSIPIIIGGSVAMGTVLGAVFLHEALSLRGWFGVGMISAGIALVGMDPGGAGGVHG
jgi:bacterial/archaeal transporter family protein